MIDWDFIGGLEGTRLTGYVPDPQGSQSGVTVGTGVDLGQLSQGELASLPAPLQATLGPYVGLRGTTALAKLENLPLTLSAADVDALDGVVEGADIAPVRAQFQKVTGNSFNALPAPVQTVIASVAFQYGALWVRCPQFWAKCVVQDYRGMVAVLKNFGDRYETRRWTEAAYLQKELGLTDP